MKLILDMSALDVEKRKMVVDYLQDNAVPLTWAADVAPSDIYADVAASIKEQRILGELRTMHRPYVGFDLASLKDRTVGKHPALAAPYTNTARTPNEHVELQDLPKPHPVLNFAQEWADAEARRQQGLEPKADPEQLKYNRTDVARLLKTEWQEKQGGLVWSYCPPNKADEATLVISRVTAGGHIWVEKTLTGQSAFTQARKFLLMLTEYKTPATPKHTATTRRCPFCSAMPEYTHRDGTPVCKCTTRGCMGADRWLEYEDFEALNVTLKTPALRREGLEPMPGTPSYAPEVCAGSGGKHHWKPTESTIGAHLRCEHCGYKIFGPYDCLPSYPSMRKLREEAPALRREEHVFRRPNEVAQLCHGTSTKHRWAPTQFTHLSEARPILECVHCGVRIYGPYEELPLHLRNEDDPSVNMHHQD